MTLLRSLRWRLLLGGAVGIVVAALVAAWLLGTAAERSLLHALDRRMELELDQLIGAAQWTDDGTLRLRQEPRDARYTRVFSGWYWQISSAGNGLQSRSLWDNRLNVTTGAARTIQTISGPRQQQLRTVGQVVTFPDGRGATFRVAADVAEVRAEAREFRRLGAAAMAVIAAMLLIGNLWQVAYGLRPVTRMRQTLAGIKEGDNVRFEGDRLPTEIAPLALQVNLLLDEHERQVQRARHGAHDLAHALKTPLAVLAVESSHPDAAFPARVLEQVDRMRAVIDRRLAGAISADPRQRCRVVAVLEPIRQALGRAYFDRALRIASDVPPDAVFAGSAEDLEEMLGNLMDNACKWAASAVQVTVEVTLPAMRITIEDDGPGLTPELRQRALARGVRLDERVPGSGLGLAIVEDIARSYGGALTLESGTTSGLRAVLCLPAHGSLPDA